MSKIATQTGAFRFDSKFYREVPRAQVAGRSIALILGVVLAAIAVAYFYQNRILGEDLALGQQTRPTEAVVNGKVINSWRSVDASTRYTADAWPRGAHEGVWLGNSQIYAINQPTPDAQPSVTHVSKALGWTMYGLNLPNMNFQEALILNEFAQSRRKADWVVLVMVFDDLREDDVRSEMRDLTSPELERALSSTPTGKVLAGQLARHAKALSADLQGTTRSTDTWILGRSLQEWCEEKLETALSSVWPVWRERGQVRVGIAVRLHQLRNQLFGITSATVRPVLAAPYEKNMSALGELFERNRARGINTLAYIAPLRRDVPPPYDMVKYEAWKTEVKALAEKHGVIFADLDQGVVPDSVWGTVNGQDIDFMHYQEPGHRLVAERIVGIINQRLGTSPGPQGRKD